MAKNPSRRLTEQERADRHRQGPRASAARRRGVAVVRGVGAVGPRPGDVSLVFARYLGARCPLAVGSSG
jgi:hypothetical protein